MRHAPAALLGLLAVAAGAVPGAAAAVSMTVPEVVLPSAVKIPDAPGAVAARFQPPALTPEVYFGAFEGIPPLQAAMAPAESAAPSAAAELRAPSGEPPATSGEEAQAAQSLRFDGAKAAEGSAGGGKSGGAALVAADPAQAEWLGQIVATARRSKTARAVLAQVDALTRARGRPLLVAIGGVSSSAAAEYALDHELVSVGRGSLKDPPEAVAPLLLHELQHALQYAGSVPSGAIETELEAYVVQFRVADELGWKPPRSEFHAAARRKLEAGVDRFVDYVKNAYKQSLGLVGSSMEELEAKLELRRRRQVGRRARLEKELADKEQILERMRETGQSEEAIRRFQLDERDTLLVRLRDAAHELTWMERDLQILRDPVLRKRYRAYAGNVMRRVRAYRRSLAGR